MPQSQNERDQAYENGAYIVGADDYAEAWERDAAHFRDSVSCELDCSYGAHERAKYDVFMPDDTPRGVMIFVHGGYWKARSKSDWSHFAQGGLSKGFAVVLIGYPLAPEVRIREITSFVMLAISQIATQIPGPIVLAGHSAGGHLVARMVMENVLLPEVSERISHVMPISPVSDLRPLLDLTLNDDLGIDAKEAASESPALGARIAGIPVSVVVGSEERPAFLDQARWLSEAWNCAHIILPGRHHFDVIDGLKDADSKIMQALFAELF